MESGASTSVDHGGMSNGIEQILYPSPSDQIAWDSNTKHSLLPGVPDEITLNHILTKLPWRTVYALASLGRAWRSALRSGDVHDARVRANSTQTLVSMVHDDPSLAFRNYRFAVSLYDFSQDTWHLLPQIPGIISGIPENCSCISVHGKLFILGGRGEAPLYFSREVHEFDPAGPGQWRQCASMICGRASFACDVKDGKIYVFGGMGAEGAAEIYDPAQDVWHGIAPMLTNRVQHKVVRVGDEFYLHMGRSFDRDWNDATFAEVYDSNKDEWRRIENFTELAKKVEAVLVMRERMFKILDDWLQVYDQPAGKWKTCGAISWDVIKFRRYVQSSNYMEVAASAIAVNGEVLALVCGLSPANEMVWTPLRSCVSYSQKLSWKKIHSPLHFRQCHCMCAIEL
jgi:hypothetical protein